MTSKVYLSRTIDKDSIKKISKAVGTRKICKEGRVAVKVHFGEKGNSRFVSPENIAPIIEDIKKANDNLFLTDSNTLYRGMRLNATDHKKIAKQHGFEELNTKIIIADGETGDDSVEIRIDRNHYKNVDIAKEIAKSDCMVVISHFKGHMLFGFGGIIKNLGMGCSSRSGKLRMHSDISPSVNKSKCIGCGICASECAVNAIKIENKIANITNKCTGCAKCIRVCPSDAIMIPWMGTTNKKAMEKCAEFAYGAVKDKKVIYITFINNVSLQCDCMDDSDIISNDVGIVASTDPVACDMAAYDLLKKTNGKDVFFDHHKVDGTHILDYAQSIGLGSKEYEIEEI